jgi:rSAM/selenodomain-associated transferase 2
MAAPITLGIVIPTLNAARGLAATLDAIAAAPAAGLVADVVIADGGSTDGTPDLARRHGARVVETTRGRGRQLAAGADSAAGDWLMFLHADTVPERGWAEAAAAFCRDPENRERAAHFRFALDDAAPAARRVERLVAWRCRRLGLPYGDQGLLIARRFYEALGGFRPLPLMEDVDLVRRIGRRRLVALAPRAVTSAERYRREGYTVRALRNLACQSLWRLGLPARLILRLYR